MYTWTRQKVRSSSFDIRVRLVVSTSRQIETPKVTLELLGLLTSVVAAIFQIYFTKMIITEKK
jgi:hypothetical protein